MQAAKETGALQAAKDMLEKQVEELTLRLEQEKQMRVHLFPVYIYTRYSNNAPMLLLGCMYIYVYPK